MSEKREKKDKTKPHKRTINMDGYMKMASIGHFHERKHNELHTKQYLIA